jgi:phospholipase D1/2
LLTLPSPTGRFLAAFAAVVLASLLMVPLTVVAVLAGLVFDGWLGFAHVFTGALLASAIGFIGGGFLSQGAIDRLSGSRFGQLSKRLAKRGTLAVAILRLIPIAPFNVFNLVAGASHLGFFQFIIGSALGLAPGIAAITLFSSTLWAAVSMPSWSNVSFALGVGGALAAFVLWAKRWLRSG